jgi:hypothetical protein
MNNLALANLFQGVILKCYIHCVCSLKNIILFSNEEWCLLGCYVVWLL